MQLRVKLVLIKELIENIKEMKERHEREIFEYNFTLNKKNQEIDFLNVNYEKLVKQVIYYIKQFKNKLDRVFK